jgi:hypothetical protein
MSCSKKPPTRRRKPTPTHPSISIPIKIVAKPIKGCECGKPSRRGWAHTAYGCYEEDS